MNGRTTLETELSEALSDVLRMLRAVRFTVGLGKGQLARIEKAEAVLAKASPSPVISCERARP